MVKLFISYAHVDKEFKEELEKHLAVLKRNGDIAPWTDKGIIAGEEWDKSISDALNEAELIVLLISPDFLSSDYCYDIEMRDALKRHQDKKAIVVPIILRYCDWMSTPFAGLQVLPALGKPIKDWDDVDKAYFDVVDGLKRSIRVIGKPVDQRPQAVDNDNQRSGYAAEQKQYAAAAPKGAGQGKLIGGIIAVAAVALISYLVIAKPFSKADVVPTSADSAAAAKAAADSIAARKHVKPKVQPVTPPVVPPTPQPEPQPAPAPQPAPQPAPPQGGVVNGGNVGQVYYNGGNFQRTGYRQWLEHAPDGAHSYYATGNDEWSIYLKDRDRNTVIQLDLYQKKIFIDWNNANRRLLYPITNAVAR